MEKPFEFKALVARMQGNGLIKAEDAVKALAEDVFAWLEESTALSDNLVVKLFGPIIAQTKPLILNAIDGLDNQPG